MKRLLVVLTIVPLLGCSLAPSTWSRTHTTMNVRDVRPQQVGSDVELALGVTGADFTVSQRTLPVCRQVESGNWVFHESGVTQNGPGYAIMGILSGALGVVSFIFWLKDFPDSQLWLIPMGLGALGAALLTGKKGGGQTVTRTVQGGPAVRWQSASLLPCPASTPTLDAVARAATLTARYADGQWLTWNVQVPVRGPAVLRRVRERVAAVGAACGPATVTVQATAANAPGPSEVGGAATLLRNRGASVTVPPGAESALYELAPGSTEETVARRCEATREARCLADEASKRGPACRDECLLRAEPSLCDLEAADCRLVAQGVLDCEQLKRACLTQRKADAASLASCQAECVKESASVTCRARAGTGVDPAWATVPRLPAAPAQLKLDDWFRPDPPPPGLTPPAGRAVSAPASSPAPGAPAPELPAARASALPERDGSAAQGKLVRPLGAAWRYAETEPGACVGKTFMLLELAEPFGGRSAGQTIALQLAAPPRLNVGQRAQFDGLRHVGQGPDGTPVYCGESAAPGAPAGATGRVVVTCPPIGVVSVDGEQRGTARPTLELELPVGTRKVTCTNPELGEAAFTVEVRAGEVVTRQLQY